MEKYVIERAKEAGLMVAFMHLTIRQAAKELGVSKTTVHKDITERLKKIDPDLHVAVRNQLDHHIKMRSYRGGQALREKLKKAS